ncbi:hypothetical protein J3R30DRAFT_3684624 [Lentinula aciculospora]|uniref:DUF6533 domain-containing protein n=1 Tax=Lentinula aciculospora TaxID=153920 RepID=A0A9W9A4S4_9AGAR|nr:hypothetical protein J3R30DRAFT_3684624 [Lentinula aciculospora]
MDTILTQGSIIGYLSDQSILSYFVVSCTALFLYDWILMLPVEIEFVWTANLLVPSNVLYIIQRYMPFVDTIASPYIFLFAKPINPDICHVLYDISGCIVEEGFQINDRPAFILLVLLDTQLLYVSQVSTVTHMYVPSIS